MHRKRTKLIFNPISGVAGKSPFQLMDVISQMQAHQLTPEVYLIEPECDLVGEVKRSLKDGIRLFVVAGGDGTIDSVAEAMAGSSGTLGIIPTGTQNNVALSLGIPGDIPSAVDILEKGQRIKVDLGQVICGKAKKSFLEVCSVGLISNLFPSADDIQHGNLVRIGDFLSTLVSSPPAEMRLILDKKRLINTQGHVILVSNMPYIGPHFNVGDGVSHNDGLLDVLLFADLTKLDLLGYAVQEVTGSGLEDPRIQHLRVHRITINTNPAMSVLADGVTLGEGPLQIKTIHQALAVMVGKPGMYPEPNVAPVLED